MTKRLRLRYTSYFFLLVNTVCWGGALVITKPSLEYTTPYLFLFYRFTLATLLTLPILVYYLLQHRLRKHLTSILLAEIVGTVIYLSLVYQGLALSSAIESSLLASTLPLFIVIASVVVLKEKQTRREWFGLSTSVLGILLIVALPIINGQAKLTGVSMTGNLLIVLANIIAAIYVIHAKKKYQHLPKFFIASVSFLLGMTAFGIISLQQASWSIPNWSAAIASDWSHPSVWVAVIFMALFGSIIGLTTYIKGQEHIEASEASLFFYLQPFVYLPLGVLLLGETIVPVQIIGLILILAGVIYAEQPFSSRRR